MSEDNVSTKVFLYKLKNIENCIIVSTISFLYYFLVILECVLITFSLGSYQLFSSIKILLIFAVTVVVFTCYIYL